MRTFGNIIWHIPYFGFMSAFGVFIMGILMILTIIGAPVGFGLLQLSKFLLTPFSCAMVDKKDANIEDNSIWQSFSVVARILYFPFGLMLSIMLVLQIAFLFISLIGIPVGIVLSKALGTYFNPVNKVCISKELYDEIVRKKVNGIMNTQNETNQI
jgi:uncharacterized membrane protein YccF (DUF307 family)